MGSLVSLASWPRTVSVEAVNRQILEYTGQSLEELKNWGTNGTVHHEDLPHVAEVFTRSIAAGIPYQIEQRLRRFDGEYRWFDNRGVPVRDDSGRIAALVRSANGHRGSHASAGATCSRCRRISPT